MANKEATQSILKIIANVKAKFAELDALDEQFVDLDAAMPEGDGMQQFDLLSDKREELEQEIRSMRERVQLISEWEKFKGSGWSDDVQAELSSLDSQFATIADGDSMNDPMMPEAPLDPLSPELPEAPMVPESPEVPLSPETPVDATEVPASEPMPTEAMDAPTADPLPAPVASSKNSPIKQKTQYELHDKKGSKDSSDLKKGDTHMANTNNLSLKEKLAEVKNKREAISKEAKTRVASAWTIAKTTLPTAPASVQKAFAASLLSNSTQVLKAALRQTAINAHYQKLAETFKEVHKVELNDLLEDPSVLNSEKKSVSSEIKGDAKNAGSKLADDRKECGPQDGTYDDGLGGRKGFGSDFDASKAAERPDAGEKPGQTQNLSDGKSDKAASAKTACVGKDCTGCKNEDCKGNKKAAKACVGKDCKGCDECKGKKANVKKADGEFPVAEETETVSEEAPAEEGMSEEVEAPAEMPAEVPSDPEAEATEILTDEKKQVLEEKIDEAQAAIKAIESEILQEGDEELDLAKLEGEDEAMGDMETMEGDEEFDAPAEGEEEIDFTKVFDNDAMEEKAASLANEGEKSAGEEDDFFAPSANLEASMDEDGMGDMHSMFSLQGSDGDPLAALIAGLKTAEQVAGMDVIPSSTGEAADHFESDEATGDDRDSDNDHTGDLWAEAIEDITPEDQGAKRVKQDSTNELHAPKAAKATLKKIHTASGADRTPRFDAGHALFGEDED